MNLSCETWTKDNYQISTDKKRLDTEKIFTFISQTYWGKNRTLVIVKKSIENSLCFGVYDNNHQIGFARVISDFSITSFLFDVYILPTYQNQGLGKWLIETITTYPLIKNTTLVLATKDKHSFYKKIGFESHANPERIMVLLC